MTRMVPELVPTSPILCTKLEGGRLTHISFNHNPQVYNYGGSTVKSGFEPGAPCLRSRYLTARGGGIGSEDKKLEEKETVLWYDRRMKYEGIFEKMRTKLTKEVVQSISGMILQHISFQK
ncbi:hypothetical protein AVEN_85223-1 [Araneus ventricosus]|uniref:Uncharacterized protein n=1 Tax=Araneus ventricosus TaxID=182803 RepID=A0A4Y2EC21_ARAVE|nr:hypothetical protein AVEN_85223-1 [Araneus ventricosus]